MYNPVRGGTRGGQGDFKWSDVASDKDRENYLGHSVNAPVGRWQNGKDLTWYNKDSATGDAERAAEIKRIKEAEEDALAVALGFAPVVRPPPGSVPSPPAPDSNETILAKAREKEQRRAEKEARRAERAQKREERERRHGSGRGEKERRRSRSRSRSPRRDERREDRGERGGRVKEEGRDRPPHWHAYDEDRRRVRDPYDDDRRLPASREGERGALRDREREGGEKRRSRSPGGGGGRRW